MRCCTPFFWDEVGEIQVEWPKLVQQAIDKVDIIKKMIKTTHDRQTSYVNTKRPPLHIHP